MEDREKLPGRQPNEHMRNEELRQGVHDLGEIFGLRGLEVEIQSGAGWKCTKLPEGIKITVDPQQLIERRGPDGKDISAEADITQIDERYILHTSGHELGHGKDFIDPDWRVPPGGSSNHFFWNVIDDTVIDKRLRYVPALDAITDQLYGQVLFPVDDLTDQPKHVQLMHGILLDTVTNNPLPEVDPSVSEKLEELRHFESQGEVFDILETMSDPRTTLKERRAIAQKFIMPSYKELLEQDQQEQAGDQSEGEGSGSFDEHYDKYEQTVHGGEHNHSDEQSDPRKDHDESGKEGESSNDAEKDESQSMDHAGQIAAVLKESSGSSDAISETMATAIGKAAGEANMDLSKEEVLSNLAGTVASKMNINPGDAREYVSSLDKWAQTIRETAQVFLQLAAPTVATMSPRYDGRSMPEGVRLHPQRLAETALQLDSGQQQSVWQPIERRAKRQNVAFGGMDIHLLVDLSGSMANSGKAACAAACSQILLEGIQLARYETTQAGPQQTQPDVQTQVIGFGADTAILAPLAFQPTEPQKGTVFSNIMHPSSDSTLIGGALAEVHKNTALNPGREAIVVVVSDGIFGDHNVAKKQIDELPKNVHTAHLVIGSEANEYISENHQNVSSPSKLPHTLYEVLASRIRSMQA